MAIRLRSKATNKYTKMYKPIDIDSTNVLPGSVLNRYVDAKNSIMLDLIISKCTINSNKLIYDIYDLSVAPYAIIAGISPDFSYLNIEEITTEPKELAISNHLIISNKHDLLYVTSNGEITNAASYANSLCIGKVINRTFLPNAILVELCLPITTSVINTIEITSPVLKSSGLFCSRCGEFYPYAESNQTDGSLICYSCRH